MRRALWDGRRIGALKRLWADGETAGAIAKELGLSRSAVLGKIFRLRLEAGAAGERAAAKSKDAARQARAGRTAAAGAPLRRRGAGATANAELPRPPTNAARKSLLELTNSCCRWPYGELGKGNYLFCGAPGAALDDGIPYCARHMRRAYIIAPMPAFKSASSKSSYVKSSGFRSRRFILQSAEEER
jgi:GcrA cell cycle regulator